MKYHIQERGVSNVIGNILLILITFILTIGVLFYSLNILNSSNNVNENNYLFGMLNENGQNVSVTIIHGKIGVPFKMELIIKNIPVISGTIYNINNALLSGIYNSTNVRIKIENVNQVNYLESGDIINFVNLTASTLINANLIIIYKNTIVLDMPL